MKDHTARDHATETLTDRRTVFVGIRMPAQLKRRIEDAAARDHRSASKQIVHYLEGLPDLRDGPAMA
jgi:hypothetical protein